MFNNDYLVFGFVFISSFLFYINFNKAKIKNSKNEKLVNLFVYMLLVIFILLLLILVKNIYLDAKFFIKQ